VKLKTLACCNCGASLEIPIGVGFVTCKHCHSSLEIQESKDVSFTKLAKGIQKQTGKILQEVKILKLQNELEQVEKKWEKDKMTPHFGIGAFRKEHSLIFLSILTGLCIAFIAALMFKMQDWHYALMGIATFALSTNPFGFFFKKKKDPRKEMYELKKKQIQNKMQEISSETKN
jgi:Flp pilus assembly protein TadB